jgi:hypothetical protein
VRKDGSSRWLLLLSKLFNDLGNLRLELDNIGAPSFQGDVPEGWTVLLFASANVQAVLIRLDKPLVCRGNLDEVLLRGGVPLPHVILLCERPVVVQSLLTLFIGRFRPVRLYFLY